MSDGLKKFMQGLEEAACYPCSCCAQGAVKRMLEAYAGLSEGEKSLANFYLGAKLIEHFYKNE